MTVDAHALTAHLRTLSVHDVGVHLPPGPDLDAVTSACREAGKNVVGIDARPDVVVTADGMLNDGVVRPLKVEVDEAVPAARTVIVLRIVGDAPLAPTLDAYLETEMIEGRDVWFDDLVRTRSLGGSRFAPS